MAPSIKVTLGLALLFIFLFVDGTLAKNTIYNGESLNTGEYLENEPYKFVMQGDCNLVLYKDYGKTTIWSTHTERKGKNCQATLLNNGKLLVVGDSGTVLWDSSKIDYPNLFRLVLQSDGNVVIYGASLWHTNTTRPSSDGNNQLAHRPYVPSCLSHQINSRFVQAITDAHPYVSRVQEKNTIYNGESLNTEEYLENEPYKFVMQGDCNLVLYKDYGKTMIWLTHTERKGKNCQAALLNNGKLVVVGDSGTVLWDSGKTDYPNLFHLVLQSDGNVVIYGASLWHTNTAQPQRNEIDLMSVTELE
ncbi:hypothetical protein Sjap_004221 [Stephania japonica]|uniref:Bulb-type lectin domain-containing protein n=1 Tax=Stephania japonica TaxID=461633 RepID=A0AAP0K3E5_9MAGN